MTEKTAEWYQKELGDRFQHFYMLLDGSYNFPNNLEGDLLRMTHSMLILMEKEDRQPPFAVGEYYVTKGLTFKVIAGDQKDRIQTLFLINGALVKSSRSLKDDTFKNSTPATAEQIATFKRAEQFAKNGRKLDEFKKGDIVQNIKTMQLGLVESVDGDGDAWVNYNMDVPLIYPNCLKCTGALYLDLIQTAEELQEVENSENI